MTDPTMPDNAADRREFVRVPAKFNVAALQIHYSAGANTHMLGEAKNVGAGGLLFVSNRSCKVGDEIKVCLALSSPQDPNHPSDQTGPTPKPITAVCRVLRVTEQPDGDFEVAACFEQVYEDDKDALCSFVEAEASRLGLDTQVPAAAL